ncbi:MAG: peptidylprolyl isomerase [Lachnospiraceae bacterium]|nr:peptidylprolyl isomerase [Lachnospiraceae bacterium]
MRRKKRIIRILIRLVPIVLIAVALIVLAGLLLKGCAKGNDGSKIVITKTLGKNEIFRIGDEICTTPEIMVFLTTTQCEYEKVYGSQIWNTSLDGVTIETYVKDKVLEKVAQIKSMYLLAKSKGMALEERDKAFAQSAAKDYLGQMTEAQREALGIKEETVQKLFEEYALANKVYLDITGDVNPEISDDEARIITIQHILIRTSSRDADGNWVEFKTVEKNAAYEKATQVWEEANAGKVSFEELAARYSEDSTVQYSFGKGEMDPSLEAVAFQLETGQISTVVESASGYHVLKCISTYDAEETQENKKKILADRRNEVFGEEYDTFVEALARKLNDEAWAEVTLIRDGSLPMVDFFDIYDKFFQGK